MTEPTSYAINTSKAISETLDGETIIINLETGTYYSMNPAGTALWAAIGEGKAISAEASGVRTFLDTLLADGLITPRETAGTLAASVDDPVITKYTDMQEMLLADPIHDVDEGGWPNLKQ